MNLLKSTVGAAALVATLASGHAEARTWWIYDFGKDLCHIAQYSPDEMIQHFRSDNRYSGPPDVETYPRGSRTVHGVAIKAMYQNGNSTTLLYFDTPQYCQSVREGMINDGYTPDRSQLQ
jgi:hypothetical protein